MNNNVSRDPHFVILAWVYCDARSQ